MELPNPPPAATTPPPIPAVPISEMSPDRRHGLNKVYHLLVGTDVKPLEDNPKDLIKKYGKDVKPPEISINYECLYALLNGDIELMRTYKPYKGKEDSVILDNITVLTLYQNCFPHVNPAKPKEVVWP